MSKIKYKMCHFSTLLCHEVIKHLLVNYTKKAILNLLEALRQLKRRVGEMCAQMYSVSVFPNQESAYLIDKKVIYLLNINFKIYIQILFS